MSDAKYFVSIADALASSETDMSLDMGNYLNKCQKGELTIMDGDPSRSVYAHTGARALTIQFVPSEILKLVKTLKPYPNLSADMKAGFAEGLNAAIPAKRNSADFPEMIVRLAHGLDKYPEIQEILHDRLKAHDLEVVTGKSKAGWGDAQLTASFTDKATGNVTQFKPHSYGPYISDRVTAPDVKALPAVVLG